MANADANCRRALSGDDGSLVHHNAQKNGAEEIRIVGRCFDHTPLIVRKQAIC